MKKLGLSLSAIVLVAAATFAQPAIKEKADKKEHGRQFHQGHKGMEQLNLSDDQKAQMKASRADFHKQMKALESNENQTVKQLRDQRASLAKAQKAKFESILTPDQKSKMTEMKVKGRQKHEEHFAKHIDKMKQELNLSDNQVATIKKNQEANSGKIKAIMQNDQLDRTAKKEQLKAMRAEMKQNMDKILTKEQQEKMESKREAMKGKMKDRKDRFSERKEVKK
ncbi:MAG: hypothetical protein ABIX01_19995 [Chitinophagaceae bacterium]